VKKNLLGGLALLLVLLASAFYWESTQKIETFHASISEALSGSQDLEGFKKAEQPRTFDFPKDHGPHPQFQTEWWYYTGNLKDGQGRHFGYQLTFFRRALRPEAPSTSSAWRTQQIYFAHFAISDISNKKFYSQERFSRSGLDLSGAQDSPYRVWLEDWQVFSQEGKTFIVAREKGFSLNLELLPLKKPVLQGNRGLSQKSAGKGNASYYYSLPRIQTVGKIQIGTEEFTVQGLSWLDREWSTSVLNEQQEGWDWFALQFEDGRELMLYQLRLKGGKIDTYSAGMLINQKGEGIALKAEDFNINPSRRWTSPQTGITYPAAWQIKIPRFNLSLTVTPYQADQEHRHNFVYWEGAVQVSGDGVSGSGYAELTGYGSPQKME